MKIFFDTNVYVAEALLGEAAEQMLEATQRASWRMYACAHILDELERVITEQLGFSQRLASLSRRRIIRRASMVEPGTSRHEVPLVRLNPYRAANNSSQFLYSNAYFWLNDAKRWE
jgi:predicted nucleic acid-binding protein